jgi:hypothetical protein
MLLALMVPAFGAGIHVPSDEGRIDPTKVAETSPFNELGVVEVAPGHDAARPVAGIWAFMRSISPWVKSHICRH